ncbi:MAG: hypothetical protein E6Y45_00335, partial [Finegoldia magna]|nr:hypothetical protein [Finegoldia magna]
VDIVYSIPNDIKTYEKMPKVLKYIFFTIIPKTPTLLLAIKISEIINTNIIINFVEELAFFLLLDFD